jgi:hypothetical protein
MQAAKSGMIVFFRSALKAGESRVDNCNMNAQY